MKNIFVCIFFLVTINGFAQINHLAFEVGSPQKHIGVALYKDTFAFTKYNSYGHFVEVKTLFSGKYYYSHDTLFLLTKDNTFKLKKEADEIYSLISPVYTPTDTLYVGDKLYANTTYYPNGQTKQTGGWNKDGQRSGVWMYYDSSGNERKRLFENGKLINDNFKWDWEK